MQEHNLPGKSKPFLKVLLVFWIFVGPAIPGSAQTKVSFEKLDFFKDPGKTWNIVGDVNADIHQAGLLTVSKGNGILANLPTKKDKGADLYSVEEYGDMDLEVDYLVASGSNSGIYLQGMYEIQILDSWGNPNPRPGDNGGIYERWDDSKPDGQKGYQGYAPRQNVSRAPGLWQHLKVSFQAPRFDGAGKKTENARMLKVELNGVTIHENVELYGPTRGGIFAQEVERGPLRIQGDHGAVAFRNLKITSYDKQKPELQDLAYEVYEGRFEQEPDYSQLKPSHAGEQEILSSNIRIGSKQFLIKYIGNLHIKEEGEYSLNLNVPGGGGILRINGEETIAMAQNRKRENVRLSAGDHPIELVYAKMMDWVEPGLGLGISGPGIREFQLSNSNSEGRSPADPILIDPKDRPVLRSFMDIPNGPRVSHAISVGTQNKVHYTYDLDKGNLVQVWRGDFLNATPMWNSRGDGSSRPLGTVVHLGQPALILAALESADAAWNTDTTGTSYRPRGYKVKEKENHIVYTYESFGAAIEDDVEILENGQGLKRKLTVQNPVGDLYMRLAAGPEIIDMGNGLYLIGDKSYYIQIDQEGKAQPSIRKVGDQQELIISNPDKLSYTLLF